MAPKGKSSASAGTRKKQAKKAAQKAGIDPSAVQPGSGQPAQRGQKKSKQDKKAPKVKQYIPPPPPPRGEPDPVDRLGLGRAGSSVTAETIVTLRKVAKRDATTVERGLEEWEEWARKAVAEGQTEDELLETMQVWTHHFPRLVGHPSRRVRSLAASLHAFFLQEPTLRATLVAPAELEREAYIGGWLTSVYDPDRGVRRTADKSWNDIFGWEDDGASLNATEYTQELLHHLSRLIFASDEDSTAEGGTTTPQKSSRAGVAAVDQEAVTRKVIALDEPPSLTRSRLRASALEALAYLLRSHPKPSQQSQPSFEDFVGREEVWGLLDKSQEEEGNVRKAAWIVLQALLSRPDLNDLLASSIRLIAQQALPSAFAESDQGVQSTLIVPLLDLVKLHPEVWTLTEHDGDDTASEGTVDGNEEAEPDGADEETDHTGDAAPIPSILQDLFTFLSLGCNGNPFFLYPAVRRLLDSVPPSFLNSEATVDPFFAHFWAASDGRALATAGPKGVRAFVAAWGDACSFWQTRLPETSMARVGPEQVRRMWEAYLGSAKTGSAVRDGPFSVAAPTLVNVLDLLGGEALSSAQTFIHESALAELGDTSAADIGRLSKVIDFFQLSHGRPNGYAASTSWQDLFREATDGLASADDGHAARCAQVIAASLRGAGGADFLVDANLRTSLVSRAVARLSPTPSSIDLGLLTALLVSDGGELSRSTWTAVASPNVLSAAAPATPELLIHLLDVLESHKDLSRSFPNANLDAVAIDIAGRALIEPGSEIKLGLVTARLVQSPSPIVTDAFVVDVLALLRSRLEALSRTTLSGPCPTNAELAASFSILVQLIEDSKSTARVLDSQDGLPILAASLKISELLPCRSDADTEATRSASSLDVPQALQSASRQVRESLLQVLLSDLRAALLDPASKAHPIDLATAGRRAAEFLAPADVSGHLFGSLIPSPSFYAAEFDEALSIPPTSSLAIIDSLVWPSDEQAKTDDRMIYQRSILALFDIVMNDRAATKSQLWVLEHALFTSLACRDRIAVPSPPGCTPFSRLTEPEAKALASVAETTVAYLVSVNSRGLDQQWHASTVAAIRKPAQTFERFASIVVRLGSKARTNSQAARCFRRLLELIFRYGDAAQPEAERWLALAQSSSPSLAAAIALALQDYLLGSPRYERYQNEVASDLAGVTPAAANAKGTSLLRLLSVVAPPLDSPYIFLPQQRAIFLLQTLQKWVSSDDELSDEVHGRLAELFVNLAPVVQSLPGAHWDLMFDILESNVEVAAWDDAASLPALWHSCRLYAALRDLSTANKSLREAVTPRMRQIIPTLRDLFVARPTSTLDNAPAGAIANLILDLLRDLPTAAMTMAGSFDELLSLVASPSTQARVAAFAMATAVISQHTESLVVEAELDTDGTQVYELPSSLMKLLGQPPSPMSALLGWALVFGFFENASFRLRASYNAQLRNADLVSSRLLPLLFEHLGVSDRGRPFDVSRWGVDQLDVSLIDDDSAESITLLAGFVYFRALRAVSSHIRSWWDECRNKQLSMAVQSFTGRHFSPLLISRELDRVRDPSAMSTLKDEALTVRVSSMANEVKAIYTVDEQTMEVAIRVPSEYPLQSIEVVDIKKVGIAEAQWRAWLLAIQQTVTTQSGTILEALSLFKRNVSLHFEGVEACAICYSIISVTDRSLPTKACRTCHNKFHPSCLFKWFSTSHGSSCPLCRSLF